MKKIYQFRATMWRRQEIAVNTFTASNIIFSTEEDWTGEYATPEEALAASKAFSPSLEPIKGIHGELSGYISHATGQPVNHLVREVWVES